MKVLLAVDGSEHSRVAVMEVARRPWPPDTEVLVLSVAHPIPDVKDPLLITQACHIDSEKWERERAERTVHEMSRLLRQHRRRLRVSAHICSGLPKEEIVSEAKRWSADLILVGTHGYGPVERFLLGSVALSVALYAPCSVEIVRAKSQDSEGSPQTT